MAFPTTAPATIDNGKHNGLGFAVTFANGDLGIIYREAAQEAAAGDYGVIKMRVSTDGGATWGGATTIQHENVASGDATNVDLRDLGGGVTSTGRLVVFWDRYNPDTGVSLSLVAKYSDAGSATTSGDFSSAITIPIGSNTDWSPYGEMIRVADTAGSPTYLQLWYGINGTTYTVYAIKSTDNGATWGSQQTVVTATGGLHYTEASAAYLGSNNLVALVREDNGTVFRQCKSTDNSASPWTNQGDISFDSWASHPSPPLLKTFTESGVLNIAAYWVNRPASELRVTYCTAANALAGVSSWAAPGSVNFWSLQSGLSSTISGGYPMVVQDVNSKLFVGYFMDYVSATDARLMGAILNINIGNASVFGAPATEGSQYLDAYKVTLPVAGTLKSATFYIAGGTNAQKARYALYHDSAGSPFGQALISTTSSEVNVGAGAAAAWVPLAFPDTAVLAGDAHLALWGGTVTVSTGLKVSTDTAGVNTNHYKQTNDYSSSNPADDPFPSSGTTSNTRISAWLTMAPTVPIGAFTNTVRPSISGTVQVGQLLTRVQGTWTPTPVTYTYRWQQADDTNGTNLADIGGATGTSYVIGTALAGKYIRVGETPH